MWVKYNTRQWKTRDPIELNADFDARGATFNYIAGQQYNYSDYVQYVPVYPIFVPWYMPTYSMVSPRALTTLRLSSYWLRLTTSVQICIWWRHTAHRSIMRRWP